MHDMELCPSCLTRSRRHRLVMRSSAANRRVAWTGGSSDSLGQYGFQHISRRSEAPNLESIVTFLFLGLNSAYLPASILLVTKGTHHVHSPPQIICKHYDPGIHDDLQTQEHEADSGRLH